MGNDHEQLLENENDLNSENEFENDENINPNCDFKDGRLLRSRIRNLQRERRRSLRLRLREEEEKESRRSEESEKGPSKIGRGRETTSAVNFGKELEEKNQNRDT